MLHAHTHFPVVEQAAKVVFQREGLLGGTLREYVYFILEVGALSGFCRSGVAAEGENLGAKLRAGGAEEVCLLLNHDHRLAPKLYNRIRWYSMKRSIHFRHRI